MGLVFGHFPHLFRRNGSLAPFGSSYRSNYAALASFAHATAALLGDAYRPTYNMPQSGKVFDYGLNKEVQLYLYVNASDVYLSSSTTVCIFLAGATGDDEVDTFEGCVEEGRCVYKDADLVYSDDACAGQQNDDAGGGECPGGGPGFGYIDTARFYSHVEFACKVPATAAGSVRVSFSANGFSGNERALDPVGGFRTTNGLTVTSYGCDPGEYASSPTVACRVCAPGKRAETEGTSCSACPRRTYQPLAGQIECLTCPDNTETNTTGTVSPTRCTCSEGYYTLDGVGGVACDLCVDHAICPGGRAPPYPVQGFYRGGGGGGGGGGGSSSDSMRLCSPPTACVGGADNGCAAGYGGPRCGLCEDGYFRLAHYCAACPDPALVSYLLPFQLLCFSCACLALTLAFDTLSKYATMSVFVRFAQTLLVMAYYEVAWQGSFDYYFVTASQGVLDLVNTDVYPIDFFPILQVANFFGPLLFFPLFGTTSAPGCPNDAGVDWEGVVDGFFGVSYFSLDSLASWVLAAILLLELATHGGAGRLLRFQQRLVALVATCLPAACTYVTQKVLCGVVGDAASSGACTATSPAQRSVLAMLVGALAFTSSTFYGVATAEAGRGRANENGPWCFLTRNKVAQHAGHEALTAMRSVLLVAFTVLTDNGVFQAGMALCVLLVSLIYQVLHAPYKAAQANRLEVISLSALVVVAFVAMVGSIGELDDADIADCLKYAGLALVCATTGYALAVISAEVRESRAEATKAQRYVRVSLGLQLPSARELDEERQLESLVAFVREIIQAMLQVRLSVSPSALAGPSQLHKAPIPRPLFPLSCL